MKRLTGILIFCLILLTRLHAQHYNFTTYSIQDGLSQSVVNCVFQDSKGFIWIGTQNGLDRFDGREFELYRFNPADSGSISNNWIYAISEDRDNNLWIGTKGGLHKYFRNENRFERIAYETNYPFNVSQYSYDNICLKSGKILVNTPPDVSVLDPTDNSFLHFTNNFSYDPSVGDVQIPVLEDRDGAVWVGSTSGLAKFSVADGTFDYCAFEKSDGTISAEENITALFQDKSGRIWAGTATSLYLSRSGSTRFREMTFELESGEAFRFQFVIRDIVEDSRGNLIVATEGNGIFFVSPAPEGRYSIRNFMRNNSGIGHNIVQCLLLDRSENLWAGTLSGISKTDLKPKKFKLYQNNNLPNSTDLLGNVMAGLFQNDDGMIWAGNWGQGLNLVHPETKDVEHFSSQHADNHYLANDFIHVIVKDSGGNIWLGTRNGIYIYDAPENRFVEWTVFFDQPRLPRFENIRIYDIIQDGNDNYWIASANGLYKVNAGFSSVEVFHTDAPERRRLRANLIYSVLEDSEGLIWIASISGLEMYDPKNEKITHFSQGLDGLSSDFLISLCEDGDGNIWIGSNAYLNILDKRKMEFSYLGKEDGLPSNYIYEIRKDKNNDMWLATGNGLCRFQRNSKKLEVFTMEDGLQSPEFNLRASFVCANGELLFGGMNGFNVVSPDSIPGNPFVPNLEFTSFYKAVDDEQVPVNLANTAQVILTHKERFFTINFAALEFTDPENNRYKYKMEGISDAWVETGNRNFVPFYGLPPGDYTFSVMGANNDGVWGSREISLKVKVQPPWWRSNYAYFAYFVLLLLSIWIFIKLREQHLLNDKMELERSVKERTLQINRQNEIISAKNEALNELNRTKDKFFSIIGHDLRNHFNIILGFSEELLGNFRKIDDQKKEQYISNIHRSSTHAHDLLGNLLTWARVQRNAINFDPEVFNVNEKVRELLCFHEEAALKKNILIDVYTQQQIFVNADVNMFDTIYRNLLANAIKFTPADGEIAISTKANAAFCEIRIRDNGVGIARENLDKIFRIDSNVTTNGTEGEKGTGLGLVICKEFVEKQGGKIGVESEPGAGSVFWFTLPLEVGS